MITLFKEIKKGLPHFSNVTASMTLTFEKKPDDKELEKQWAFINQEIAQQLQVVPPEMVLEKAKEVPETKENEEILPF